MKHTGTIKLETRRLILRRYEQTDADEMFQNWVADPEAARFWSWEPHKDIQQTRSLLAEWIREYDKCRYYHWVITLKETHQAIGYIYLADVDDDACSASVHYLIGRKYWNQGLASEALTEVLSFAMNEVGFLSVFSWHHIDNPASGRVMEKCGMHFVRQEYRSSETAGLSGSYRYYEMKKQ